MQISGKTFLNTIEYLDENTNEWTTFVPKDNAELSLLRSRSRTNSRRSVSEDIFPIQNVPEVKVKLTSPEAETNGTSEPKVNGTAEAGDH